MKTIQSKFEGTSKADTLNYSGTMGGLGNMTTAERLRQKKMQKAD